MTGESTFEFRSDRRRDARGAHGDYRLEVVSQGAQVVELFSAQFHEGLDKLVGDWVTG